jgi:hypothetical protein
VTTLARRMLPTERGKEHRIGFVSHTISIDRWHDLALFDLGHPPKAGPGGAILVYFVGKYAVASFISRELLYPVD